MSRQELEGRKAQAVRFTRDVLGDDNRADEIEHESLDDYAERRHIKLENPKGRISMAVPTRSELLERIQELESENEDLQSKLDEIGDLVSGDGEGEEEEEDDDRGKSSAPAVRRLLERASTPNYRLGEALQGQRT